MRLLITRPARKQLKSIGPTRPLIIAKIKQYVADPESLAANVKALKGSGQLRLRVGDYRVFFHVDTESMTVTAIKHRSEAYD